MILLWHENNTAINPPCSHGTLHHYAVSGAMTCQVTYNVTMQQVQEYKTWGDLFRAFQSISNLCVSSHHCLVSPICQHPMERSRHHRFQWV